MKKFRIVFLMVFAVGFFQFLSCNNSHGFINENAEKGFHLAQRYCKSCHLLPMPQQLNKATWIQYVLPKMGGFLGFRSLGPERYFADSKPAMKLEDWNNIVLYYYS